MAGCITGKMTAYQRFPVENQFFDDTYGFVNNLSRCRIHYHNNTTYVANISSPTMGDSSENIPDDYTNYSLDLGNQLAMRS